MYFQEHRLTTHELNEARTFPRPGLFECPNLPEQCPETNSKD